MRKFIPKRVLAERYGGVHQATIDRWVREGRLPAPVKLGGPNGACLWAEDILLAWEQKELATAGALEARA